MSLLEELGQVRAAIRCIDEVHSGGAKWHFCDSAFGVWLFAGLSHLLRQDRYPHIQPDGIPSVDRRQRDVWRGRYGHLATGGSE